MERKAWVVSYMRELDRKKRKAILDQAILEEGLSPENDLRRQLFEARYGLQSGTEVDHFVRGWMSMLYLGNNTRGLFAARRTAREKASIRSDWKMDLAETFGSTGRTVLYEEFYNLVRLYIDLCRNDRTYSSYLLGLGTMNEGSLAAKIARDIRQTAFVTATEIGENSEFSGLTEAAEEAFADVYPDDVHLLHKGAGKER